MSYSGASVSVPRLSSEFGSRRAGWGPKGTIVIEDIPITTNAVDAVITIAASQTSPRTVTIQLNNPDGTPIAHAQVFDINIMADNAGLAFAATGGSTGLAKDSTAGDLLALVAKKAFLATTNAVGLWSGTWTDSAHEVAFLQVKLPTGRNYQGAATALTTA